MTRTLILFDLTLRITNSKENPIEVSKINAPIKSKKDQFIELLPSNCSINGIPNRRILIKKIIFCALFNFNSEGFIYKIYNSINCVIMFIVSIIHFLTHLSENGRDYLIIKFFISFCKFALLFGPIPVDTY